MVLRVEKEDAYPIVVVVGWMGQGGKREEALLTLHQPKIWSSLFSPRTSRIPRSARLVLEQFCSFGHLV
jgi:hypothetical protein